MTTKTVAFVGLGNMGLPMAQNLHAAGFDVRVFDLSADAMSRAKAEGLALAASAGSAVQGVGTVITMLPADQHVAAVYLGETGIINQVDAGTLLIDSSTISVETARQVAGAANAKDLSLLDAPVSGGAAGAAAGALTFMVGGDASAFDAARPIFEAMGKNIFHAGGHGNGQAAKICNNMILGISMIAVSEAFALAKNLGLDAQTLFDISATASGQCWSLTSYCPEPGLVPASPSNRDYQPGFATDMMLKDLRLAQIAAQSTGTSTPLGAEAYQLYNLFALMGNGAKDFSAIIKMLKS